ncbi:aldehyde dehydrogenase (NADP(+)) [Amycolatopsis cynarae]|uniref:Aldehyde dehydrogenase (NADP(+)) n=1 Tax=Amycolatopsis cynarae TaxID=2995223 RepID=A0ABY7BFR9_9PSEU|nr:aldehyde dehydrogenase (NADP(+)) [Amycolatopsis sp. HUAS 11-8]
MLIGAQWVTGTGPEVRSWDPRTGEPLDPAYHYGGDEEVARAASLAEAAFGPYRATDSATRARFLDRIAEEITARGDAIVQRAHRETALPPARLTGEVARTTGQLRLFGETLREGSWQGARIDPALPGRTPLPRPDLRQRRIGLGPVAVFGASNFPLAFSVAGGDTASALAAGCPVVVKAHDAHLGTSELVAAAVRAAVEACELPEGVFSLLVGDGPELGTRLVTDPRIRAVGFTGSRAAGLALVRAAAARPQPIPVYAEMSSVNPVVVLPGALAARAGRLGADFVASLTLGAGQFCTNPGLVLVLDGPGLDEFLAAAAKAVAANGGATMLTTGIARGYAERRDGIAGRPGVTELARGASGEGAACGAAALFTVDAAAFLADPALHEEVFGATSVVIRCSGTEELTTVLRGLEGQLTATVHAEPEDHALAAALLPLLELRAGRILVNGWPTGVEVGHAMVHGGPFPATSDARTTSVGSLAIERFLRPVAYQDVPAALLPPVLRDGNPEGVWRRVDGTLTRD